MRVFQPAEVVQFAVRIEENGERFYREAAKSVEDKKVADILTFLADEEIRHKKLFEDMLSKVERYEPPESYPGEYFAYLHSYTDSHIFSKDKGLPYAIKQMKNAPEIVEFAIEIEIASILYYTEAKNLLPDSQQPIMDKIVAEERKHFANLMDMKKKL